MTRRNLLVSFMIAIASVVVVLILHSPISSVEDQVTSLKYQVRGSLQADTNIVIVYIDDDAMKDLGWPVRRSFYALMVKALTDLQARAIGIDVLFEEPNVYPEYDDLLAATIGSSKRVVLSSYFRSLSTVAPWRSWQSGYGFRANFRTVFKTHFGPHGASPFLKNEKADSNT